jgi:hypothetical protein
MIGLSALHRNCPKDITNIKVVFAMPIGVQELASNTYQWTNSLNALLKVSYLQDRLRLMRNRILIAAPLAELSTSVIKGMFRAPAGKTKSE